MRSKLSTKLIILTLFVPATILLSFSIFIIIDKKNQLILTQGKRLESIVASTALSLRLPKLTTFALSQTKGQSTLRHQLVQIAYENEMAVDSLFILRFTSTNELEYVFSLEENRHSGLNYDPPKNLKPQYQNALLGASSHSLPYDKNQESWITAIAPLKSSKGHVWGILQANHSINSSLQLLYQEIFWVLFLGTLGFALAFVLALIFTRRALQPVADLKNFLALASQGDFKHLEISGHDELAEVAIHGNDLIDYFRKTQEAFHQKSNAHISLIDSSADDVLVVSHRLKDIAHEQTSEIVEAERNLKKMRDIFLDIDNHSTKQRDRSAQTNDVVEKLALDFDRLNSSIGDAHTIALTASEQIHLSNRVVNQTISDIDGIQKKSENLTELIELLNSISEKLQMLSLNASIEAARSADSNSGFQIVANEITELSDKTTRNTSQAIDQLKDVTKSISKGTSSLKEGVKAFDAIFTSIGKLSETLKQLKGQSKFYLESTQQIDQTMLTIHAAASQINKKVAEASNTQQSVLKIIENLSREVHIVTQESEQMNKRGRALAEFSRHLELQIK